MKQNEFQKLTFEKFNHIDKRFNNLDSKIDSYHGRKRKEIITALIGSPIAVVIITFIFTKI